MDWIFDILIVLILAAIVGLWIISMRKRLIKLWREVTYYEVAFYRKLGDVTRLYYDQLSLLQTEDNKEYVRIIRRYRKKRIRSLLLHIRQDVYNAIAILSDQIEELNQQQLEQLITEFDALQKIRRVYNSKVLIYNQTISVFPTRYLALRMNLELKEYFG